MPQGRPKSETPRSVAVQVKFTEEEKELLDLLVAAFAEEARAHGGEATMASVMRLLVLREVKARGLGKPVGKKKGAKR